MPRIPPIRKKHILKQSIFVALTIECHDLAAVPGDRAGHVGGQVRAGGVAPSGAAQELIHGGVAESLERGRGHSQRRAGVEEGASAGTGEQEVAVRGGGRAGGALLALGPVLAQGRRAELVPFSLELPGIESEEKKGQQLNSFLKAVPKDREWSEVT